MSLTANSSANVLSLTSIILGYTLYVKIMTLLLTLKNVNGVVQSGGNLNKLGSLRRKITIIGDGHVGI